MSPLLELAERWRIEAATLPENSARRLTLFQCANQLEAAMGDELRAARELAGKQDENLTEALQAVEDAAHLRTLPAPESVATQAAGILCDLWEVYAARGLSRDDIGLFTSPASDALDAAALIARRRKKAHLRTI